MLLFYSLFVEQSLFDHQWCSQQAELPPSIAGWKLLSFHLQGKTQTGVGKHYHTILLSRLSYHIIFRMVTLQSHRTSFASYPGSFPLKEPGYEVNTSQCYSQSVNCTMPSANNCSQT